MAISIPTGLFDIVPHDGKEAWRNVHLWQFVESVIREHARLYHCQEIRTPLLERTELFQRSVGDATDIVSKEMYTFLDRGERSMSLRPEGTASVMRAFVEKGMHSEGSNHRLYYIGPMFRYERPQAGRYRQHHQFGVEMIGSKEPLQDAELIEMLFSFYTKLGLKDLVVKINSLGGEQTRLEFREKLCAYLKPHYEHLSPESQRRFKENPLRVLDSKNEDDKKLIAQAPSILDCLNQEELTHFQSVCAFLKAMKIPYEVNAQLVRGLDYYNGTVFEVAYERLGAQNSIGGGGRYDGLLKKLGGPSLPTVGFGTGIERILQTLLLQQVAVPEAEGPFIYVIPIGQQASYRCVALTAELRRKNISCQLDVSGKKVKNGMQMANQSGAFFTLVIGDNELATDVGELKHMASGKTMKVLLDQASYLLGLISKLQTVKKRANHAYQWAEEIMLHFDQQ